MNGKAISVRFSEKMAKELDALARAEGVPVSEAIRAAVHRYIATCRSNQAFKERLKKRLEEDRELLERLSE
ncbi:MAG: ribbon-helix-helix domain-containing protein [Solirubrobacterales bacterium]